LEKTLIVQSNKKSSHKPPFFLKNIPPKQLELPVQKGRAPQQASPIIYSKKQAKDIVAEKVKSVGMPYVTERWPGGMLTNFATIRKAVRKMSSIDTMMKDPTFTNISKRERLQITRERAKLEKQLGSIADLNRLPSALFIVDIMKEHIAVAESRKLNIPTFAMVDTNSDPKLVDFPIPANDDASKSIALIVEIMVRAIEEGMMERKVEKDKQFKEEDEGIESIKTRTRQELEAELEEDKDEDERTIKKEEIRKLKKTEEEETGQKEKRARKGTAIRKK
jgi:small subunit ribosomal protein S2